MSDENTEDATDPGPPSPSDHDTPTRGRPRGRARRKRTRPRGTGTRTVSRPARRSPQRDRPTSSSGQPRPLESTRVDAPAGREEAQLCPCAEFDEPCHLHMIRPGTWGAGQQLPLTSERQRLPTEGVDGTEQTPAQPTSGLSQVNGADPLHTQYSNNNRALDREETQRGHPLQSRELDRAGDPGGSAAAPPET